MVNYENKTRNSNLEILRIISMVLIVSHHYSIHGFGTIGLEYSLNRYVVGILALGGKLGVACFVLISGYFMVYSKFILRKLIKLVAETYFYSLGIGILFIVVLKPVNPITLESLFRMFLPIGYKYYWFMTDYIMLMLISPAINILISNMSKNMHRNILIGATILWSVMANFTLATYDFNSLGWFVVLYCYSAYIRKYMDLEKRNAYKHILIAIVSYSMVIVSNISLIFLGHITHIELFDTYSTHFMDLNSPFILLSSVELLIGFVKLKPFYNRKINILSSATLGVYLIHDNSLVRPYLWGVILKNSEMYSNNLLIVHAIISIISVYIICSFIDVIRQYTVEKLFMSIVDKYLELIINKVHKTMNIVNKKIYSVIEWYYK